MEGNCPYCDTPLSESIRVIQDIPFKDMRDDQFYGDVDISFVVIKCIKCNKLLHASPWTNPRVYPESSDE